MLLLPFSQHVAVEDRVFFIHFLFLVNELNVANLSIIFEKTKILEKKFIITR